MHRPRSSYLLFLVLVLCPGCQFFTTVTANIAYEGAMRTDNLLTHCINHQVAKDAWKEVRRENPNARECASKDYERGFLRGFTDFLDFGGTGTPPPLPPHRYWFICHQTPAGHQAIQDWYAGFQHGSAMAGGSGRRELVIVPTSVVALPPGPPGSSGSGGQMSGDPTGNPTGTSSSPAPVPPPGYPAFMPEEILAPPPRPLASPPAGEILGAAPRNAPSRSPTPYATVPSGE